MLFTPQSADAASSPGSTMACQEPRLRLRLRCRTGWHGRFPVSYLFPGPCASLRRPPDGEPCKQGLARQRAYTQDVSIFAALVFQNSHKWLNIIPCFGYKFFPVLAMLQEQGLVKTPKVSTPAKSIKQNSPKHQYLKPIPAAYSKCTSSQ